MRYRHFHFVHEGRMFLQLFTHWPFLLLCLICGLVIVFAFRRVKRGPRGG